MYIVQIYAVNKVNNYCYLNYNVPIIICKFTVDAQNIPIDIVTAHPGQDIELPCNITSGIVSWRLNNIGRYSLSELSSGRIHGYSSSGNNLIVKDILVNDFRDGYLFKCWTQSTTTTTKFTLNNQYLLYVVGEYQYVCDVMYTTV